MTTPPAVDVKAIADSLVPELLSTLIVCPVPAVACNLIASVILPSADISIPPSLASILMAAADVPLLFVIVILSLVAVLAVNAMSPAVAIVNEEVLPVIATPPTADVKAMAASPVPPVFNTLIV